MVLRAEKDEERRWLPQPIQQLLVVSGKFDTGTEGRRVEKCVILSNAEVNEYDCLTDSILVASGEVRARGMIDYSYLVARRTVQTGISNELVACAGGAIVGSDGKPISAKMSNHYPNDTKLLSVKFYSTTEDGLEAMAEKGVVTVTKLDAKKAFGVAGLKKGDVIVSINGEKVTTLHELDRLACRATVASGTAKVKVERDKKTEEIEVKLFDWSAYTPEKKK